MTPGELTARVTSGSAAATAALGTVAALVGGAALALGVLAGGALALLSFRWVVRGALGACAAVGARRPRGAWLAAAAVRLIALFAALALAVASGWVHPLGLMAGLAIVPCVLIARTLGAREAA